MLGNTFYPLVCADDDRLKSLFPLAEQISKESGMPYRIVQFSSKRDITQEIKQEMQSSENAARTAEAIEQIARKLAQN
jgi:hypothetical protein